MDLTKKLHIEDAVELTVDGGFFEKSGGKDEKYLGYVASLDSRVIGLSVTSPSNKFHGYTDRKSSLILNMNVVEIDTRHVRDYRIL